MDPSGKLIYTSNHDVLSGNLQTISDPSSSSLTSTSFTDGSRLPLSTKEIGSTEIFATSLLHSSNGRFVTAVGDGKYIIYTSLAWRNKNFGNGISFAWAPDSNTLRFDRDAYNAKVEEGAEITDEGVEEAFEVVTEVSEG